MAFRLHLLLFQIHKTVLTISNLSQEIDRLPIDRYIISLYNIGYIINDQKFFYTQIVMASIGSFLHESGENISGYLKTSDPLYHMVNISYSLYDIEDLY